MPGIAPSLKQKLGCWFYERWKAEIVLNLPLVSRLVGWDWSSMCNRNEKIKFDSLTSGYICEWQDSSRMTLARIFPSTGAKLMQLSLNKWPIGFRKETKKVTPSKPDVSFIIGVRGLNRLLQFEACLESLIAQEGCSFEIIVVEQSWDKQYEEIIQQGVRYIYTQSTDPEMPYNRSWALNAGVEGARGKILVLLDADMIVPIKFAAEISKRMAEQVDVMRLPRYIFYLDESTGKEVIASRNVSAVISVSTIVQNARNPIAIKANAYRAIGGHDESFYGWGGEDSEFIERARTLRFCEGGFMPIIHLWHEEAPKRHRKANLDRLNSVLKTPVDERISSLKARAYGQIIPSIGWPKSSELEI